MKFARSKSSLVTASGFCDARLVVCSRNRTLTLNHLDRHREYRVRAARVLVHVSRRDRTVLFAQVLELLKFVYVVDDVAREVFDVNASLLRLFEFQRFRTGLVEQITDFFVVDFVVGSAHQKLSVVRTLRDESEDMCEAVVQNTRRRECLSGSGLAIRENSSWSTNCDQRFLSRNHSPL